MSEMQTIIAYLKRIDEKVDRGFAEIHEEMDRRFAELHAEMDRRFAEFHEEMDRRFVELREEMDRRFAELHEEMAELREEMATMEFALQTEIEKVYQIAKANQENIEVLLIPFNDRNLHISKEVTKIPQIEERQEAVERTVQSHSVKIRKLEESIA